MRSKLRARLVLGMALTFVMGMSVFAIAPAAHASTIRVAHTNVLHSVPDSKPGVSPQSSGGYACNSDGTLDVCVFPYGPNVFTQATVVSTPCYNAYQRLQVVGDIAHIYDINNYYPGVCKWGAVYTLGESNVTAGGGLVGWYAEGCYSVLPSGGPRYCVNSPTIWIPSL